MCKVLISGGGSGGHIFPALAIANEWRAQDPDVKIKFVGAYGKMEMEKIPQAGYEIIGLWISGMHRKSSLKNLLLPFKVIFSLIKSLWILLSFKPNIVVGVGGFASGPLLIVASWLGIPTAIQEQNGFPGITNKILSKRVDRIFTAFPGLERFFPKEKIQLLGNPVRSSIGEKVNLKEAYEHFDLQSNLKTVLVFGGSLGAKSLNEAVGGAFDFIKEREDVQWIWQTGRLYYDQYQFNEVAQLAQVKMLQFIDQMNFAYAVADVIVCRAGALTLAELAIVSKPAILVPSPNVAEDHQTKNAMVLVEKDAALLCADSDLTLGLWQKIDDLLSDASQRDELRNNIGLFSKPRATKDIVEQLKSMIS